jgi:hypothetical protein
MYIYVYGVITNITDPSRQTGEHKPRDQPKFLHIWDHISKIDR